MSKIKPDPNDDYVFPFPHTEEQPIDPIDPACPCREDPENIAILNNAVTDGLLTPGEATDIIKAKHV